MRRACFALFLLIPVAVMSQSIERSVIATAGGIMQGRSNGVVLSWTLGESAVGSLSSSSYLLTQGFQQGNLSGTGVLNPELEDLGIGIYPNPVSKTLYMRFTSAAPEQFSIVCYDLMGRMVLEERFNGTNGENQISIEAGGLSAGLYVVRVISGNKPIFSAKFVKTEQ